MRLGWLESTSIVLGLGLGLGLWLGLGLGWGAVNGAVAALRIADVCVFCCAGLDCRRLQGSETCCHSGAPHTHNQRDTFSEVIVDHLETEAHEKRIEVDFVLF